MIPLALDEIRSLAPGRLESVPGADVVTGIQIDSRRVAVGDLFVAVRSGVDYVPEALERGAAAALVPEDAFAALAALGGAVRERSSARVVAVTGSVGKTTTKDILGALCGPHASTVVAEGSQNNEIGLPLTLCRIEADTQVVVLEMGMRGLGQIAELCAVARPNVGVVTSIGPVHLELLGTIENVARAKAELIDALPPGGAAVVPSDEPLLEPFVGRSDLRVLRFGAGGDVSLEAFRPGPTGSEIDVEVLGERLTLGLPIGARHNATNFLAALAAYVALGFPVAEAGRGGAAIKLSRWRGEEFPLPGGGVLVNDAYNANPVSMAAALDHLGERAGSSRKVAILGEMAELGPAGADYHRQVGEAATHAGVSVLVAVGSLAAEYLEGAHVPTMRWAANAQAALAEASALLEPGDWVLVKGSRSVGLEVVAEGLAGIPA
ncbi:MAG TPA: UDP-N-acetylmuramoyl-tripeptide--D-alanyl-D-alanine ligase [Gaiellaceae bacterium]|nr:UDP-N-acetylmuramoyl-tripeptide--D-alanyl-D-alanine ligase [Gaiellaceae bacterium]